MLTLQKLAGFAAFSQTKWKFRFFYRSANSKPRLEPATSKHMAFKDFLFTADFRSPGSWVSRQFFKGWFSSSPPNSNTQIPLSPPPDACYQKIVTDTLSGFLCSVGHFEAISGGKRCHPTLPLDLVTPLGLIGGYLELLFEERTPVFSHPVQLIHLGKLALDSLRFSINGVNMNFTVNCGSLVHVDDCGLLFQ